MENKIIVGVITATIVIIMVAAALVPVINDASATSDTFTNAGDFEVRYTAADSVNMVWDPGQPNVITINDVPVALPTLNNGEQRTILCGDSWLIRAGFGTSLGGYFVQWYPASGPNILASVANGYTMTVSCIEGSVTVTDSADSPSTATADYTYLYYIANEGDYVMKKPTESVYLNSDSEFYAMGITNIGTIQSVGIKATGSIADGVSWSVFRGTGSFDFTDSVINTESIDKYVDLYKLSSISATVTSGDNTTTAVYSYFIVPAEVTAERVIHASAGQIALYNAIPVMIFVVLIVALIGYGIYRNRD